MQCSRHLPAPDEPHPNRLRDAALRLQPSKCALCRKQVQFLGHIISRDGVSTDPAKAEKVAQQPRPTSVQEVQQFLGLAIYYQRFVRHFSSIAKPLYRLTERGHEFKWTLECDKAFAEIKTRLMSPPVLAFPDSPNRSFWTLMRATLESGLYSLRYREGKCWQS